MDVRKSLFPLLLILVLFAGVSWSQITTGSMRGEVNDDEGKPIPGANVVISSPALLGGSRTTQTNEQGVFRFQSLPVGEYAVEVTLEGFQKINVAHVDVRLNATANVPLTMKMSSVSEQVTVSGEAPLIDVTQAGAPTSFSKEIMENVPTQRSFTNLMQVAPGVSASYGDGGGDRTIAFGSNQQSNSWSVDGLQLTAPETGSTWLSYAPDSIQEIQVIGVGAPAEYGNYQGAVFNVVTKKGGNSFHGSANYFFQNNALTGTNVTLPECNPPAGNNPNPLPAGTACAGSNFGALPNAYRGQYYDVSATLGGPIAKDKLWFYGDMQLLHDFYTDPGNNPDHAVPYEDKIYDAKATGLLGQKNEWNGFFHWETWASSAYDPYSELTSIYQERGVSNPGWGGGLTSTISNNFLLEVRYAGWSTHDIQNGAQPNVLDPFYDQTPPGGGPYLYSGGVLYPFDYFTDRDQVNAKATYYAENFLKSQHEFRFGVQWSHGSADTLTAAGPNGFYTYNYYGGEYYDYQFRYYQMPFHYGGVSKELGFFVDDTVTVNDRLTLNLGLRYDHNTGDIPSYPILAIGTPSISEAGNWIETGAFSDPVRYMTWNTVSPRLGFVLQTQEGGKSVLQGSFGVYYDHNVIGNWDSPSTTTTDGVMYQFFPGSDNFHVGQSGTLGDEISRTHYQNIVNPDIKPPRTLQYAIGYEQQIKQDMAIGVQYVYKDTTDLIGWNITGGLWEPVQYTDPWTGKAYTLLKQIEAPLLRKGNSVGDFCSHIVGGATASMCDQNLNYFQKYHGAILTFTKKFSNNWALEASYTWSHSYGLNPRPLEQVQFNPFYGSTRGSGPNNWINAYGNLLGNRPNMIRLQGFWHNLPWGINLAANVDFSNGRQYTRQIRPSGSLVNQTSSQRRFIVDRDLAHPWFHVIDLTLGKRFEFGKDVVVNLNGTIYNVLNADNSLTFTPAGSTGLVLPANDPNAVFTEGGWTKPRRLQIQLGLQF